MAGFIHPFSGIDHLLAMISVGLWGAFLGGPSMYVLPVIFPAMMVVGAILGMFAVPLPPLACAMWSAHTAAVCPALYLASPD